MANKKNSTQDIEIATLKEWKRGFDRFVRNELHHLNIKMDRIENKIFYGLLLTVVSLIITQIILKIFT